MDYLEVCCWVIPHRVKLTILVTMPSHAVCRGFLEMHPRNDKNGADLQRRRGQKCQQRHRAKTGRADVRAMTRESRSIGRSSSQFAATAMGMSSSGRQIPTMLQEGKAGADTIFACVRLYKTRDQAYGRKTSKFTRLQTDLEEALAKRRRPRCAVTLEACCHDEHHCLHTSPSFLFPAACSSLNILSTCLLHMQRTL